MDTPNLLPCHSRSNLSKFSFVKSMIVPVENGTVSLLSLTSIFCDKSKVLKFLAQVLIFVDILLYFFVVIFKLGFPPRMVL